MSTPSVLHAGPLTVDTASFEVKLQGHSLDVTVAEVRLLALLAREPGVVRNRTELLASLGSLERGTDERTVDAHVKNLRRKFSEDAELLDTVRGVGYRLRLT